MSEMVETPRARRGVIGGLQRAEAILNRALSGIVVSLLCLSAFLAASGVALRYFAGASYDLMEELCRIAIVYASFLYVGPMIIRNAHLRMSFVTDLISTRANRYFDLVLHAGITLLIAWLLVAAWRWEMSIKAMGMQTMSGDMAAWIPSAALPIGLAIALFYSALRVIYRAAGIEIETSGDAE